MDFNTIFHAVAVFGPPVLFAITVHEAAHGYAARYFGDNTAAMLGRITLNPLRHIDYVGTILIPILLYISTAGALLFGYAKPVPVRFGQLRNPQRDMIWVALAGPASNFVQALLWGIMAHLAHFIYGLGANASGYAGAALAFVAEMCGAGLLVNVVMFVFNLFPLPPLDGGRILLGLLPYRQATLLAKVEPWGFFIVLALVISGIIGSFWMQPLMAATRNVLIVLLWPLRVLLGG